MTLTTRDTLQILGEVCGVSVDALTPESHLTRDLDLDSVLAMDLLMTLEERLETDISEVEAAGLVTVGDVLEFVRKRGQASG